MSDNDIVALDLILEPADNERLANLCGQFDENLREVEERIRVRVGNGGNRFHLSGTAADVEKDARVISSLYELAAEEFISPDRVHIALQESHMDRDEASEDSGVVAFLETPRRRVHARGRNQAAYLRRMREKDLNFGIGPAGTGKTYLAVAAAVAALETDEVRRIVLVRPAVEAGERLGFLPGDMKDKVDPYMQPLYDALNDFLPGKQVAKLIEDKRIEIAPLAFMRGRTLSNAFVVLDEAQNATTMQMKMFLTRLGEGSRMVVTGDRSQVDLPRGVFSGLHDAEKLLKGIGDISFNLCGFFGTS